MAEKRTIELEIQDNSKTLKQQYKEAVVELQKVAAAYGETSQQAAEAAKKAAGLKDRIEDTNDAIKAFKGEGAFNALGKSVSSVASGFSAVEGAMGLVGVESEKLQETMLRVQSAMALAQGLEGLEDAGRAFKQLGAVAINALKGIKGALAATGIGLFVVALGTVVAYWDEIKEAVSGVSAEQAKLNEETHKNFETSKEQLSTLDAQDNVLKLQGKSERQILNIKIAQINATIEKGKIELENVLKTSKAEEAAAIQNYNMTKKIVDFTLEAALFLPKLMLKPIDLAIQGANKVSEILGFGKAISFDVGKTIEGLQDKASDFIAGSIFNVPELKKENEETAKEIRKSIADLENQKAGFQLSIKEMDKAEAQKTIDANKEKNDLIKSANAEAARLAIEQQNELNKRLEDIAEQNFQNSLTEQEREILLVNDKYFELETLAEGNKDALAEIELAKMNELNDINLKYQNIAYENDKVAKEKKAALDKEASEKEIAAAKVVAEQKAALQQQGLDVALQGVQLIASVFEKQKGVQKAAVIAESAIGIAKMIIANKLANAGALATPQAIATSGAAAAPVIAMNNISTGIGIAANIAATAKALKTLGGGSAPSSPPLGGGGGTGGGGAMAPQFNTIGSSGINQLATLQQQPVQAYVVSGEVTSAQSLDRNRVQNATL
jgi:hypothetical protein